MTLFAIQGNVHVNTSHGTLPLFRSAEGLLIGTLNGGWFWELCPDSQYLPHPLNLTPGIVAFQISNNF